MEYYSSHTLEIDVSQVHAPGPPNAHSATATISRLQITAVTATPSLRSMRRLGDLFFGHAVGRPCNRDGKGKVPGLSAPT